MTWKSYAAVSGATVLAGWIASTPPSNAPAETRAVQSPAPSRAPAQAPSDIELQAMRLEARLRSDRAYAEPVRDPFRFASRRAPAAAAEPVSPIVAAPAAAPVDVAPPAPMLSLSGIAEDQVDGRASRTAVLSTASGVLLVREGEEILGFYRVGRIEGDGVELVTMRDGSSRRLTLR